jgi:LemA protein
VLMPILGIAVVLVLLVIGVYNSLVSLKVKIKEAWSEIDIQLKRRADLIPNIVETVKGYAGHEKEVFENVTRARAALLAAKSPKEAGEADTMLGGALGRLFAVAEAYPELKAQEGFINLQKELSDTEDKVAYARSFYNSVVKQYNEKIVVIPNSLIAGAFGFKQDEFFEVEEADKANVQVKF